MAISLHPLTWGTYASSASAATWWITRLAIRRAFIAGRRIPSRCLDRCGATDLMVLRFKRMAAFVWCTWEEMLWVEMETRRARFKRRKWGAWLLMDRCLAGMATTVGISRERSARWPFLGRLSAVAKTSPVISRWETPMTSLLGKISSVAPLLDRIHSSFLVRF